MLQQTIIWRECHMNNSQELFSTIVSNHRQLIVWEQMKTIRRITAKNPPKNFTERTFSYFSIGEQWPMKNCYDSKQLVGSNESTINSLMQDQKINDSKRNRECKWYKFTLCLICWIGYCVSNNFKKNSSYWKKWTTIRLKKNTKRTFNSGFVLDS